MKNIIFVIEVPKEPKVMKPVAYWKLTESTGKRIGLQRKGARNSVAAVEMRPNQLFRMLIIILRAPCIGYSDRISFLQTNLFI